MSGRGASGDDTPPGRLCAMTAGSVTSLASDPPEPVESPEARESEAAYRPHLDGLRALAVYLVVLFHTGISSFSGGFIGVDVFFVLSGFLVTQLLLRDIARGGSIRFGRFYSRRFRRLLPAAFVTLVVTGLVFTAIAPASEVAAVVGSFKAAFLYVANLYFIRHAQDYFGAGITANPVIQFWSLAVEEQFYLLWPLALGSAYFLTRRLERSPRSSGRFESPWSRAALRRCCGRSAYRHTNLSRAYFGTESRAYELLAGAFLALTPVSRLPRGDFGGGCNSRPTLSAVRDRAARDVVGASRPDRARHRRHDHGVRVARRDRSRRRRSREALLSTRPVVYLGRISYGTYLWHWIVIIVAVRTFQLSPITTLGVTCLVGYRAGFTQLRDSGAPIRTSPFLDRHRRRGDRVRACDHGRGRARADPEDRRPGAHDEAQSARRLEPDTHAAARDISTSTFPVFPFTHCVEQAGQRLHDREGHRSQTILLLGDSHAAMMVPAFTELAKREGLSFNVSLMGLCPWQRGLTAPSVAANCRKLRTRRLHAALVGAPPRHRRGGRHRLRNARSVSERSWMTRAIGSTNAEMRALTKSSAEALRGAVDKVLLIEPVPLPAKPSDRVRSVRVPGKVEVRGAVPIHGGAVAVCVGSRLPGGGFRFPRSDPIIGPRHDGVPGAPDMRSRRGWTDREVRPVTSHDKVLAEPRAGDQFVSRTRRLPSPLEVLRGSSYSQSVLRALYAPVDGLVGCVHRGGGFVHGDLQLGHQRRDGSVERGVEPYELTGAVRTDWICHEFSIDRTAALLRRRRRS